MALPRSVIADGQVKIQWVEAIADTYAPTLTEVNAASSFDASCYFTPDGFTTGGDSTEVTDDRLCSVQTFTRVGTENNTLALRYIYQPQGQDETDNEAFLTFLRNTTGFFVARFGKPQADAFAVGDIVEVWPVELDSQRKAAVARNETLKMEQAARVIDNVTRDVAIVAGT